MRAWQAADRFEGRSSVRSWLYRIATNVCLDLLRSRNRRALPMDLSSPVPSSTPPVETRPDHEWLEPIADRDVTPAHADPAEQAVIRDTVRLAFVAALQVLPPRQRAVLILREVLCWPAADVAELLGTTVVSVNSALQRARATLAERGESPDGASSVELGEAERELLARYVQAFERYDIDALVEPAAPRRVDLDAAVRAVAARPRRPARLVPRPRDRVQGVAAAADGGQRLTRLRPVQARARRAAACPGPSRCSSCVTGGWPTSTTSSTPGSSSASACPPSSEITASRAPSRPVSARRCRSGGPRPTTSTRAPSRRLTSTTPQQHVDQGQVGTAPPDVDDDQRCVHADLRPCDG